MGRQGRARGLALALGLGLGACGGTPGIPPRSVVEADIGGWHYRRYQSMLDVEVWVPRNTGEAHAATYVTAAAERVGRIRDADLASAMVTHYQRPGGVLRELVKFARRLGGEGGYQVDEAELGGVRVILASGRGETWALWASGAYIVKVGGRGRSDVPASLVEAYGARFPSQIPGGVMEGPLPAGEPIPDGAEDLDGDGEPDEPPPAYDPDNPTPDFDQAKG
jgi:hypothetical protein